MTERLDELSRKQLMGRSTRAIPLRDNISCLSKHRPSPPHNTVARATLRVALPSNSPVSPADKPVQTLGGVCVGTRVLSADRKSHGVPTAAVGADLAVVGNVGVARATEVRLDEEGVERVGEDGSLELGVARVRDARRRRSRSAKEGRRKGSGRRARSGRGGREETAQRGDLGFGELGDEGTLGNGDAREETAGGVVREAVKRLEGVADELVVGEVATEEMHGVRVRGVWLWWWLSSCSSSSLFNKSPKQQWNRPWRDQIPPLCHTSKKSQFAVCR